MAKTKEDINAYFEKALRLINPDIILENDLRSQIDSLAIIELIELLEKDLGITINIRDFQSGFLSSLESSIKIINSKDLT